MLVLSFKPNEAVLCKVGVNGPTLRVVVTRMFNGRVRLGFEDPEGMYIILREELAEAEAAKALEASKALTESESA